MGIEPATFQCTGQCSNHPSYTGQGPCVFYTDEAGDVSAKAVQVTSPSSFKFFYGTNACSVTRVTELLLGYYRGCRRPFQGLQPAVLTTIDLTPLVREVRPQDRHTVSLGAHRALCETDSDQDLSPS